MIKVNMSYKNSVDSLKMHYNAVHNSLYLSGIY